MEKLFDSELKVMEPLWDDGPQTAGALMDTVLALEGVGLLAITHDLNGERLKRFDSILVLRDGSIIEQGSWEALMAQRGELYRLSVRT